MDRESSEGSEGSRSGRGHPLPENGRHWSAISGSSKTGWNGYGWGSQTLRPRAGPPPAPRSCGYLWTQPSATIVLVAVLFAALLNGGFVIQTTGVPGAIAHMIQALILFLVLASEAVLLRRRRRRALAATRAALPGSV